MKKLGIAITIILSIAVLMFAEYRYIMCNQIPTWGEDGLLNIEVFGQVDTYYVE